MNTKQNLEQLQELKLNGMANCYETQLGLPQQRQTDAHTLTTVMAEAEATSKSTSEPIYTCSWPDNVTRVLPEQIQCSNERNLSKEQLLFLSELSLIEMEPKYLSQTFNGCGKFYLTCDLGRKAYMLGLQNVLLLLQPVY